MTAAWPPPSAPASPPSSPPSTGTPTTTWGPLVGWLLLLVSAAAALLVVFTRVPWVTGRGFSGRITGLSADELVNTGPGLVPVAVLAAVVGLVVAAWFALAAVPAGTPGRVAVTVAVVALEVALTVGGLGDDSVTPGEAVALTALLFWLPAALLLLLVWRGARRGAARTAAVFASFALLGAVLVTVTAVSGLGTPGPGAWLALLLAAAGLAGAVLQLRSVPRPVRPLEPGDAGWTA